jgi:DNA helicase II / ATP-dependent DNA helicase PcrA
MRTDETAVGARPGGRQPYVGTERAPRRSELRRSEDYSGPFRVPAVARRRRRSRFLAHPFGTFAIVPDPLLDDLDAEQRAAVTTPHAPLAILAPAGSGKTRVLTRRIAYRIREGMAETRHVLALTFTRKAAGELVQRCNRLGVDGALTSGTFHAVALAQLRRHASDRGWDQPRVLDRKARVLGPIVGGRGSAAVQQLNDVATEIEWAKARLVPPGDYADAAPDAGRCAPGRAAAVAEFYERYEHAKHKRRLLDFDDVLRRCGELIGRDIEFAESQRWRFRHLFVDEFQDATPLQVRLLRAWLGERDDLSVVGDPAQSIYAFAGADARPITEFDHFFRGGRTIALVHNYRSTDAVVALAEAALGPAAGVRRALPATGRGRGVRPTIRAYDDEIAEAAAVADGCWSAFRTTGSWSNVAVLFRTNAQSSQFETALARRGVPARVNAGPHFASRPPVRLLLDRLRAVERDEPALGLAAHLADLATHDDEEMDNDEVASHRDALLVRGREYLAAEGRSGTVAGLVGWLDTTTRNADARDDAVELATFHRAKGLEWPIVFVTGLERGFVPIARAGSDAERAEERRLLHVALSRAADELHCSWARARTVGARRVARDPSPWLGALEELAHTLPAPTSEPARYVTELRDTLARSSPPVPHRRRARHQVR